MHSKLCSIATHFVLCCGPWHSWWCWREAKVFLVGRGGGCSRLHCPADFLLSASAGHRMAFRSLRRFPVTYRSFRMAANWWGWKPHLIWEQDPSVIPWKPLLSQLRLKAKVRIHFTQASLRLKKCHILPFSRGTSGWRQIYDFLITFYFKKSCKKTVEIPMWIASVRLLYPCSAVQWERYSYKVSWVLTVFFKRQVFALSNSIKRCW